MAETAEPMLITNEYMREGGVLGKGFQKHIINCRVVHSDVFGLSEDVNRWAHAVVTETSAKIGPTSKSVQKRLVFASLLRTLGLFQGAILIAERGLVAEVAILGRALVEAEIRLAAVALSEKYAEELLVNDKFERRTQLKALLKAPRWLTPRQQKDFTAGVAWYDRHLQGKRRSIRSLEQLAATSGETDLYNLCYRFFSGAVHSSPSNLKQHIAVMPGNTVIRFQMAPRFDLVPYFLGSVIFVELKVLEVATRFFGIESEASLEVFRKRLQSFGWKARAPEW
jgi:hypothetical protein